MIHQAVSQAIKSKGLDSYLVGEVATEGHIILEREEKDGVVKAYTLSSFGYFGFENGIFTKAFMCLIHGGFFAISNEIQ